MKRLYVFLFMSTPLAFKKIFSLFCRLLNILITKILQISICQKLFFSHKINLHQKKTVLLLYLPRKSRGWILEKLYVDIISKAKNKNNEIFFAFSIFEIFIYQSFCKIKIHSLHQEYVKKLLLFGFKPSIISSTYTHTRLDKNSLEKLKQINYVLPVNNSEANLLITGGIDKKKIIVFPQGYDPIKFNSNYLKENSEFKRDIDILYVSKFVNEFDNYHYFTRKNYVQAVEILNEIAENGKKVFILGSNWKSYESFLSPKIIVKNVSHNNYPNYYKRSKILLSTSIYEGGPVSWLEGMASGCYLISYPTGFSKDAHIPKIGNHLLPLNSKNEEIISLILYLLENYIPLTKKQIDFREKILFNARFEELYKILILIMKSKHKTRTNWIDNNFQNDMYKK